MCRHVRFDEGVFPFSMQSGAGSSSLDPGGAVRPWAVLPVPFGCGLPVGAAVPSAEPVSPMSSSPTILDVLSSSQAASAEALPVAPAPAPPRRTHPMVLQHMTRAAAAGGRALVAAVDSGDPTCYSQASWFLEWRSAMDAEFNVLLLNKT